MTDLHTYFGPYHVDRKAGGDISIRGHEADPDPSPIGQALVDFRRCRVERPAVRRGWYENGPGPAGRESGGGGASGRQGQRGRAAFVELDWDEALDLAANELARVRSTHGNQAIFAGSYGWGSHGQFHKPSAQLHRFGSMLGGYVAQRGSYSAAAAEAIIPYIFGMSIHQVYSQLTSWGVIANHTELFVSFGGFRSSNADVTYSGQGGHYTRGWLAKAAAGGMKLVSVSPLSDDVEAELIGVGGGGADSWLPIRPGTDVALMLALMYEIWAAGQADEEFLAKCCVGWDELLGYLKGAGEGSPLDADWAAQITGLEAGAICELAAEIADKRTIVNVTLSIQRADHGEQTWWAAAALACVAGQMGVRGGGLATGFFTAGNLGSGRGVKRVPKLPVPPRGPSMPLIAVSRIAELLEAQALPESERSFNYDGRSGTYPDIRLVYWCGGNPFHHHQDLNRLARAWQLPDTVIVNEPFWSPVARFADIVFPATTPLERNDLGAAEELLIYSAAASEPVGEAQDDYWVFSQLARRLGFEDAFTEGRSADEWVETLYDIYRAEHPQAPSFEEFRAAGHLRHEDLADMGDSDQVFMEALRADPSAAALGTPSGKIELASQKLAGFDYDECGAHPQWLEPYERLGGEGSEQFPLHLISNQPRTRLHSQYDFSDLSQAAKVAGREPIRIHPLAAAQRGIAEGDVVRVFNARGACLAGAVLDEAMREDVCQLSTGAWYDPDEDGMCRAGNPNVLTRDKGTSEVAQGPTPLTCLVEIEKFAGEPPRVQAYDSP